MLSSTDRLNGAPQPAPISENLPATKVSCDLAQHWVDLTTKGQMQFALGEFTEKELIEAFEAGKKLLPPGDEPLMAYYINASPLFLKHLRVFPPPLGAQPSESSNDLALFLRSHEFFQLSSVLQVFGCMEASIEREGRRCRKISENQLEIASKSEPPLYLHLPLFFENSLEFIDEALKKNEPATALCLSQALDLVVPSFFDLPAQGRTMGRNETLNEIYRILCRKKNFYAAFKLLFLFKGAGWNPLETSIVLDLPEQLSFIAKSGQFTRLLPALRAVYASTPFALLLEDMIGRVQKNPEHACESLLICKDVGILSSVWKSDVPKRVDFLVESAATMPEEALPFALAHVCKSDQIGVVGAYLERLLQQEPPFVFAATYEPNLRRSLTTLLKSDPSLEQQLNSYPRVMQIVHPESLLVRPEQLMDHMIRDLSYLTDHTIIRDLAEVLVKGPTSEALWTKCRSLVESLVTDDAFLQDAVVLLETVATTPAAVSCFEVGIPRLGPRLKPAQKQRVAQAYATAIGQQTEPRNRDKLVKALPSEDWLLGQLRKEESWQGFATVFCHLSSAQDFRDKKVVAKAVQEAEWLASRLLTLDESPLFAPFEALVCRFSKRDLDATVWKPHFAGLLARNPTNGALFDKLCELTRGEEKEAITRCRKLKAEEISQQLSAYRATGVFPDPQHAENAQLQPAIREALAKQDFVQVVSLLKKTTAPEWELWNEFIHSLPAEPTNSLVESAWTVWAQKHPAATFKPAEGQHWEDAFVRLFGKIENRSSVVVNFVTKQAIEYAVNLDGHPSEVLLGICLEKGILSSWNNKSDQRKAVVQTLATLISNKKLNQRHGSVLGLLKDNYQAYLHLLFVQEGDEKLYAIGNSWFLDVIGKTPLSDHLLKGYSMRPYVPRQLEDQILVLNWIEKSWPLNHTKLTWMDMCRLMRTLLQLKVEKFPLELRERYLLLLGQIWDVLLAILPQAQTTNPALISELFLEITNNFLIRTMKYTEKKEILYRILSQTRLAFCTTISPHIPLKAKIQFQLDYCLYLFSLLPLGFPDKDDLLNSNVDDLNLCILSSRMKNS